MKASKNKLDFEREFKPSNIPFGNIVNNNADFRNELFLQYCNAEEEPSLHLYLADFYSEDEINKGYEEASNQKPVLTSTSKVVVAASRNCKTPFESRIRELWREFDKKVREDKKKKELPLKYYCNDIEKTTIVQTLRQIDKELDILKESVFDEETDKYREAEIRANNVVELLGNLKELAPYIIDNLKQNNDNLLLHLKKANKLKFDFWQTVKSNFNNSISKALPPQQKATKPELTLKQIALLYIYNGDHITAENNNSIAEKYGNNSGHGLQQHYNKYALSTDRNSSGSRRKDQSLIKDIEKVIEYLPKGKQNKPKEEAERLRNIVQNND